eukprot:3958873-Ditylum_brightwellii.AAC.1
MGMAKALFFTCLHYLNLKEYNFARQKAAGASFISSCSCDEALAPNSAHDASAAFIVLMDVTVAPLLLVIATCQRPSHHT